MIEPRILLDFDCFGITGIGWSGKYSKTQTNPKMKVKLQELTGNWSWGTALDLHTVSSSPIFDETGTIIDWNTKRTEIGEELYQLKYRDEDAKIKAERVEKIAGEAAKVIINLIETFAERYEKKYGKPFEIYCVIPIPPSKQRAYQPVEALAKRLAEKLNISLDLNTLKKVKSTAQLKEIKNANERTKALEGAFHIQEGALLDKNVLLFDDLYRSGATLTAITEIVKSKGKAKNVLVLTVTKTRSKR